MTTITAGKPIRCKAAVCREAGKALVIEDVEVSVPGHSQARIKIICASLCHTDVTFWHMKDNPEYLPRIFGHEGVGLVESVGERVVDVKVGDMVVPTFLGICQNCVACKYKKTNICSTGVSVVPDEDAPRFRDSKGDTIHNFLSVSCFAEYTVVDVTHVTKIDPSIPPDKACLLSCGIATGIGAAWKVAKVKEGSTVVVFGLGAVGLAVAEGARLRGASKIIGVDLNSDKFEQGKKLGITDFVNPKDIGDKPISQVIKEMTNGGADYCFECIGLASVMEDAHESSQEGWGKTVILGIEMNNKPFSINSRNLVMGKTIKGSLFGGLNPQADIPILVQKYLNKELHLEEFITHEVEFQKINRAFDLLDQGKSIRCIIWINQ